MIDKESLSLQRRDLNVPTMADKFKNFHMNLYTSTEGKAIILNPDFQITQALPFRRIRLR